jgi:hypothetical protein
MGSTAFAPQAFPGFDHYHLAAARLARSPRLGHEPVNAEDLIPLTREAESILARGKIP